MKNKILLALMFVVMVVVATSCATRKYGCPSVSQAKPTSVTSAHS